MDRDRVSHKLARNEYTASVLAETFEYSVWNLRDESSMSILIRMKCTINEIVLEIEIVLDEIVHLNLYMYISNWNYIKQIHYIVCIFVETFEQLNHNGVRHYVMFCVYYYCFPSHVLK